MDTMQTRAISMEPEGITGITEVGTSLGTTGIINVGTTGIIARSSIALVASKVNDSVQAGLDAVVQRVNAGLYTGGQRRSGNGGAARQPASCCTRTMSIWIPWCSSPTAICSGVRVFAGTGIRVVKAARRDGSAAAIRRTAPAPVFRPSGAPH
jgi:hypothetical protein